MHCIFLENKKKLSLKYIYFPLKIPGKRFMLMFFSIK